MKLERTVWGMLGSVFVNAALGIAVVAVFSIAPPFQAAQAAEVTARSDAPERVPGNEHAGSSYLTAARMGWGIG